MSSALPTYGSAPDKFDPALEGGPVDEVEEITEII